MGVIPGRGDGNPRPCRARVFAVTLGTLAVSAMTSLPAQAQFSDGSSYTGEIIMFAGSFCPRGTVDAFGQSISLAENTALFSLINTQFGGDGRTAFAVPDMRQRRPVHAGDGAGLDPVRLGERGGTDTAEITMQTLPPHTHASGLEDHSHTLPAHTHEASLLATLNAPDTNDPSGAAFATFPGGNIYGTGTLDLSLAAGSTSVTPTAVETRPDTGGAPRTQPAGDGNSSIPVVAPGLVLRFCMVTDGVYPALR